MQLLRNEYKLDLCFAPLYMLENTDLKICYLNARSLHKHIDDVRKDINYLLGDILIFTETRFSSHDLNEMYAIEGYELFRNDEIFDQMLIVHIMEQLFIPGFKFWMDTHMREIIM